MLTQPFSFTLEFCLGVQLEELDERSRAALLRPNDDDVGQAPRAVGLHVSVADEVKVLLVLRNVLRRLVDLVVVLVVDAPSPFVGDAIKTSLKSKIAENKSECVSKIARSLAMQCTSLFRSPRRPSRPSSPSCPAPSAATTPTCRSGRPARRKRRGGTQDGAVRAPSSPSDLRHATNAQSLTPSRTSGERLDCLH